MAEIPEFMAAKLLLSSRQGVTLGPAVTDDMPTPALVHFQLFREGMQPFLNSGEMHADGCIYFAYTPTVNPVWYDTYPAIDTPPFLSVRPRLWANDPRTYSDLFFQNDNDSTWPNTGRPPAQGGPFPPGRGPAPRWFQICVPRGAPPANWGPGVLAQVPGPTQPLPNSGARCSFMTTGVTTAFGRGIQEWVPFEANPQGLEGLVTNGFVSGEDLTLSHLEPPPSYWLGVRVPINRGACSGGTLNLEMPTAESAREAVTARVQLCNDWEGHVRLDPQYWHLLAASSRVPGEQDPLRGFGNFGPLQAKMVLETEQWLIPVGYRPDPGDRILVTGRWIADCGHLDWHTELHPVHLIVSSYLMTGPPREFADTANRPPITDMWLQLTGGSPATVTKVVVTGAWPGGRLEFDVWPPPRPNPGTALRWRREPGLQDGVRIVSETPLPADNPNHLHVVIEAPVIDITTGRFNQVNYSARRLAAAYLMWWGAPLPTGILPAASLMRQQRL